MMHIDKETSEGENTEAQNEEALADSEAEAELEGVPEHLKADSEENEADDEIAKLTDQLATAKQEVLYAQAETQNVRRRLEKDAQDARSYAATGFARDILSVSDNLARALEAIPDEIKDEYKLIECNCFNGTGFYKHDVESIIQAVNQFIKKKLKINDTSR